VVAVRPLYGGSDHLLASGLLGFDVTFTDAQGVGAAVRPDTAMVVLETPGNPTLDLVDIARAVADAQGVPVLVDSTFTTPVLQRPLAHGATLVLHSGTKFLGGHGDVIAGAVCGPEEWARAMRQVRILTGALLHPLAAYLLHRGLQTLPLRVRAAQDGARFVAERLAGHPAVKKLLYPGLPACDPAGLVGRQMEGPGSMLSFEVASFDVAAEVMRRVDLITPAVSLGSADSLIQHPAGLTHRSMSAEAKASTGISPGLLRLSVGLEDPRDVWADLEQALDAGLKLAGARARELSAAR
jgi:methionine-gamma-lyase